MGKRIFKTEDNLVGWYGECNTSSLDIEIKKGKGQTVKLLRWRR